MDNRSLDDLPSPSLTTGWAIFASRPISMVANVIFAVCLFVVSLGILALPLIPAFYFAVRNSKRERFFIDLERVLGSMGNLLGGIKKYFFPSFVVGVFGLLVAVGLLVAPVLALREGTTAFAFGLQVLFIPAFFWGGAVLLYGYPCLLRTNRGYRSLQYAFSEGRRRPLLTVLAGFLVLFPITGAVFHLLMVFSYPVFVAAAVGEASDSASLAPGPEQERGAKPRLFFPVMIVVLIVGSVLGSQFMGAVGAVTWIGLCMSFLLAVGLSNVGVAVRLFGIAVGGTVVILGGGTVVGRLWGDRYIMPWVVLCILLLILGLRRISSDKE